jgi:hypothetical protein
MNDHYGECPSDLKASPPPGSHCTRTWYTYSSAWADYDDDGDLDLAWIGSDYWVTCEDSDSDGTGECQYHNMPDPEENCDVEDRNTWCNPQYVHLFENVTVNANHWLELRLQGNRPRNNRAGIGARVTAIVGGETLIRQVSGGTGYHSTQNSLRVHFGLGSATSVDQLTVLWPDGTENVLVDVAADQILHLEDAQCTDEVCNGRDDDCDDSVDEGFTDADEDGVAYCVDCDETNPNCTSDCMDTDADDYCVTTDCDDGDPEVNPGAAEVPYNMKDDDCSAVTPDDDLDGDGFFVLIGNIPPVDEVASGETAVSNGGVSGTYLDTQVSDDVYQVITEAIIGKGNSKQSLLEHHWTVLVSLGQEHLFQVEAFHSENSEGDDFLFDYSTDGTTFVPMVTVSKTADDDIAQGYSLPAEVVGELTIRVTDADRTQGNSAVADSIYVDRLWVRTTPDSDCDDGDPWVYPGASERCNAADDDCDGSLDEGARPPSWVTGVHLPDRVTVAWDVMPGGSAYDVVKGDLVQLVGSSGDLTGSLLGCLGNDVEETWASDNEDPDPEGGFYYLVRTIGCGQSGTYESGGPSQQGTRDDEIEASADACP